MVNSAGTDLEYDGAMLIGVRDNMVRVDGGTMRMGSDVHYREERPAHEMTVDGFWIDRHAVTNVGFTAFISATDYVAFAERPLDPVLYPDARPDLLVPGSAVVRMPRRRATCATGGSTSPAPTSGIRKGREARLPSGSATRSFMSLSRMPSPTPRWPARTCQPRPSGRTRHAAGWTAYCWGDELYCWGDEFTPDSRWMANTWQGEFPWQNQASDGFPGRVPVGSFPANGYVWPVRHCRQCLAVDKGPAVGQPAILTCDHAAAERGSRQDGLRVLGRIVGNSGWQFAQHPESVVQHHLGGRSTNARQRDDRYRRRRNGPLCALPARWHGHVRLQYARSGTLPPEGPDRNPGRKTHDRVRLRL
jgi:hypothetical protein